MLNYEYYVWVEVEANKKRIINFDAFENAVKKCVKAGIGSIILSVKDTTGFCLYNSQFVPHYTGFDQDFENVDYLKAYIKLAHENAIKLYAGIDVFSEGRTKQFNPLSPGFVHPSWQTEIYGVDETGAAKIQKVTDTNPIQTTGSIDDFNEVFVNPVIDEVQDYEVSIIQELLANYDIDGIVLDRARFVGLSSDFSDYTRMKFEEFTGKPVSVWPEDIYRLVSSEDGLKVEYGSDFGKWITFRAQIIKNFIVKVRKTIDAADKKVAFIDYTGSWYPLYYLVGANWASDSYIPQEYPWVNGAEYAQTGYAEYLDKLLSGFYYSDVTRLEAKQKCRPDYWYSVEGSGDLVQKVVGDAAPYVGSLFLQQYQNDGACFHRAVEMCFQKSSGCMLFDLCYIEDYNWWELCKI